MQANENPFEAPGDPAVPPAPPVLTVSALNQAVARSLERNFPLCWIGGEVSNFTRAASGHWYFTLKDAAAQVRAVMFRNRAQLAGFTPREGDKIEVRALVTLYAPRGDYQLSVESMRRAGVGSLFEAFLKLKEKLAAEGLFDSDRKRRPPAFPRTIGVVTSPQAAALRDILITLRRRAPHVRVILYPTPVQGEGAGVKIADAIGVASARRECDVLLVCRGGGSMEDLWSFNHEAVARAIAASPVPVVSGVGHETDFTIADFAADLRAPTPTAAAELAATPRAEWLAQLGAAAELLRRGMQRKRGEASQTLDWLSRRLISPAAYVNHERLRLQGMQLRLTHATRAPLAEARLSLAQLANRMRHQLPDAARLRQSLDRQGQQLRQQMRAQLAVRRQSLAALSAQLELLNPQRTLERGYAIVSDADGHILRAPQAIRPRSVLRVRLAEGSADISVGSVQQPLE